MPKMWASVYSIVKSGLPKSANALTIEWKSKISANQPKVETISITTLLPYDGRAPLLKPSYSMMLTTLPVVQPGIGHNKVFSSVRDIKRNLNSLQQRSNV